MQTLLAACDNRALGVLDFFQECLDCTFSWFRGMASFPMQPSSQEEEDEDDEGLDETMKETPKEKEERRSDYDVSRQDVVKVRQKWRLPFCFHLVIVVPVVD